MSKPSVITSTAALAALALSQGQSHGHSAVPTMTIQPPYGGFGFPQWLVPRAVRAPLSSPATNQRKRRKAKRQAFAAGDRRAFKR